VAVIFRFVCSFWFLRSGGRLSGVGGLGASLTNCHCGCYTPKASTCWHYLCLGGLSSLARGARSASQRRGAVARPRADRAHPECEECAISGPGFYVDFFYREDFLHLYDEFFTLGKRSSRSWNPEYQRHQFAGHFRQLHSVGPPRWSPANPVDLVCVRPFPCPVRPRLEMRGDVSGQFGVPVPRKALPHYVTDE
jgi:hypothetical protein